MSLLQALTLGLLQGATEFVPISSSAHLVLVPWLLGWPEPSLAFDTTVHWGTLMAVLAYFRHDWVRLLRAWWRSIIGRGKQEPEARLVWLILLGTVPAALAGLLFQDFFEALFGAPAWVASLLLVTGLMMFVSERVSGGQRPAGQLAPLDALLIGLAQALAIAPGISRSGATISAGLLRGLRREEAARFSFLLATPIILGAGLLPLMDLLASGVFPSALAPLLAGFVSAALSGYLCISFLLSYLRRRNLWPFALYCWIAGGLSLLLSLLS